MGPPVVNRPINLPENQPVNIEAIQNIALNTSNLLVDGKVTLYQTPIIIQGGLPNIIYDVVFGTAYLSTSYITDNPAFFLRTQFTDPTTLNVIGTIEDWFAALHLTDSPGRCTWVDVITTGNSWSLATSVPEITINSAKVIPANSPVTRILFYNFDNDTLSIFY